MIAAALSAVLVVATTVRATYVNEWDKPFEFRCPEGQVLMYISSVHENFYDDRRWEFICRTVGYTHNCVSSGLRLDWDGDLYCIIFNNDSQGYLVRCALIAHCAALSFAASPVVHLSWYPPNTLKRNMSTSINFTKKGYVNEYDKPLTYTCPGNGVIAGVESINDNYYEDRRFKFTCCDVSLRVPVECSTTDYINNFDGKMTLLVPEGQAIKSIYSWHDNYYEDRRWKVQLCQV